MSPLKLIFSSLLFLNGIASFAQHCPWDASSIMIFKIKTQTNDLKSIDNLKLTVTDSLGHPYFVSYYIENKKQIFPLVAFQNQIDSKCDGISREEMWAYRCYWFADNSYVIVTSEYNFKYGGLLLTIEDIDGEENGGNFKTLVHKIDSKNSYSLCT